MNKYLSELIDYALDRKLIEKEDETYCINRILNLIGADSFEREEYEKHENIEQILAESQKMRDEPHIYYRRKNNGMRDNWLDTDNEIALMLRKAYDCNVSFTTLSDLCGINRTQLYQYTRGIKTASDITARMIRDSLEKIFADIGA